jgi:hypothetical protein
MNGNFIFSNRKQENVKLMEIKTRENINERKNEGEKGE